VPEDKDPQLNPEVEKAPEVIQEEVRLRVRMLRLHYYREVARTVAVFLQTFKAEAVSLMSGLGTMVLGWYQLKKWVLVGRQEVRAVREGEGGGAEKVSPENQTVSKLLRQGQEALPPPPPPGGEELQMVASAPMPTPTMFSDSATYVWLGIAGVFVVSSVKAWLKRRKKATESTGA
jgi:hypothetical protein